MRRGTLGDTDGESDNASVHNFDHFTCTSLRNPYNQTKDPVRVANNLRGAARRKMTAKQRQLKQMREIIKFQKSTQLLIPKAPFVRVVRDITSKLGTDVSHYTSIALEALQEATEVYLTQVLHDSYLLTMHRKCVTLTKADMMLIRYLIYNN